MTKKLTNADEFVSLISKLDSVAFIGLTRVMCVKIFDEVEKDENGKPKPLSGEKIVANTVIKFCELPRTKRREIIRLLKKVIKEKDSYNAPTASKEVMPVAHCTETNTPTEVSN